MQAYYILDEVLIAGELQESSKKSVARVIAAQVLAFSCPFLLLLCQ
jgi:AP-1 complex subunit sigma 1/2